MARLRIFIIPDCWSCRESRQLAAAVAVRFPDLAVELLDLEKVDRPENVFAVPTYLLDGEVIFLGNPTQTELNAKIEMYVGAEGYETR